MCQGSTRVILTKHTFWAFLLHLIPICSHLIPFNQIQSNIPSFNFIHSAWSTSWPFNLTISDSILILCDLSFYFDSPHTTTVALFTLHSTQFTLNDFVKRQTLSISEAARCFCFRFGADVGQLWANFIIWSQLFKHIIQETTQDISRCTLKTFSVAWRVLANQFPKSLIIIN